MLESSQLVFHSTPYSHSKLSLEYDNEIQGGQNSYTTQFRQYDPRLGRWKSLDPVTKHHESPFASNGNNPIWFIDPSGADSVKKEGSTRWMWQVKEGETYSSISERTGVSVEDLRSFNSEKIKDDHKIPKNAIIHISDPNCPDPKKAVIKTLEGTISIDLSESFSVEGKTKGGKLACIVGAIMGVNFTPNTENTDNNVQFLWFQTIASNDPLHDAEGNKNDVFSSDRTLADSPITANDVDQGNRMAKKLDGYGLANKRIWKVTSAFPFLDMPQRFSVTDGVIRWRAVLQLYKVVNGNYELVTTIYYGFDTDQDTTNLILLRNAPDLERILDGLMEEQNKSFDKWRIGGYKK